MIHVRLAVLLAVLSVVLLFSGCQTSTFDLSDLRQPVVINGNAYIDGCPSDIQAKQVDEYSGRVFYGHMVDMAARGNEPSTITHKLNSAQVRAFEKLAEDRAITNLTITAESLSTIFGEATAVGVTGAVMEYSNGSNSVEETP